MANRHPEGGDLTQRGIEAARAGRHDEASELLVAAIKANSRDVTAWMWLAAVVKTDEDRRFCFENVLAIDPQNAAAQHGLAVLNKRQQQAAGRPMPVAPTPQPSVPEPREALAVSQPHPTPPVGGPATRRRETNWNTTALWIALGLMIVSIILVFCFTGLLLVRPDLMHNLVALAQPTPVPTATPRPTRTPFPTSTPTPSPTPTPTATPTSSASPTKDPFAAGYKIYNNTQHRFSMRYPANWAMIETDYGVAFSSERIQAEAYIGIFPNAALVAGNERLLAEFFVAMFEQEGSVETLEVTSEGTETFNGVSWRYLIVTAKYYGVNSKLHIYTRIHDDGIGYGFLGLASTAVYDEAQPVFDQMMKSFTFQSRVD